MRPKERRDSGQTDLLCSRLDAIIDMGHPLVKLARTIDWPFLEQRLTDNSASAPPDPQVRARSDRARGVKLFQARRLCMKSTGICLGSHRHRVDRSRGLQLT